MLKDYFDATDAQEEKRLPDMAKLRLQEIKDKGEEWDKFFEAAGLADSDEAERDQKARDFIVAGMKKELLRKKQSRFVNVIAPDAFKPLGIEDKDGNAVYRIIVMKNSAEDVIKACRRKGVTARPFSYDKEKWQHDNEQRQLLKENLENKTTSIKTLATDSFQELFAALMHLKVIRAYIDGVLRFGVPPKFYLGVVFPGKGQERTVLHDMNQALVDETMKDMYGEKLDATEADDYWPFVCINLTSPLHLHV